MPCHAPPPPPPPHTHAYPPQDPHFKAANHRRRIIQRTLLAEYAYLLAPGGILYTITDVEALGDWTVSGGQGGGREQGAPPPPPPASPLHLAPERIALEHRPRCVPLALPQREKLDAHPLFERVGEEELEGDPAAALLLTGTEEGQKVARNGGRTWRHCYRRLAAPREVGGGAAGAQEQQQQEEGGQVKQEEGGQVKQEGEQGQVKREEHQAAVAQ